MPLRNTEQSSDLAAGLDKRRPEEILSVLHGAQIRAARSVATALPQIEQAAAAVAACLSSGGRLVYAAAGSSALMAMADGLELPGTFGIARGKIVILMAGGPSILSDLAGGPEDDSNQAQSDVGAADLTPGDCMICLSASGSTPYAVGALEAARSNGVTTIGIANNPDTPLLERADISILLETPPEIIAGSTRMGAGTAQKIALNMISTLTAVHLGHIHDGHMVNLHADNEKLKLRARRIVCAIGGCSDADANTHLEQAGGAVKVAVLLAAGAKNVEVAKQLLESHDEKLRPSLSSIGRGRHDAENEMSD